MAELKQLLVEFPCSCTDTLQSVEITREEIEGKLAAKREYIESIKENVEDPKNDNFRQEIFIAYFELKLSTVPKQDTRRSIDHILEKEPYNILAMALQVEVLWKLGEKQQARNQMDRLRAFKNTNPSEYFLQECIAKVSLAYYLRCLGAKYILDGITLIQTIPTIERLLRVQENRNLDEELKCLYEDFQNDSYSCQDFKIESEDCIPIGILSGWCCHLMAMLDSLLYPTLLISFAPDKTFTPDNTMNMIKALAVFVLRSGCSILHGRCWKILGNSYNKYTVMGETSERYQTFSNDLNQHKCIELAYKLDPDNYGVCITYAKHRKQHMNWDTIDEVIHMFEDIIQKRPNASNVWCHLAHCYIAKREMEPPGTTILALPRGEIYSGEKDSLGYRPMKYSFQENAYGETHKHKKIGYYKLLKLSNHRIGDSETEIARNLIEKALVCMTKACELTYNSHVWLQTDLARVYILLNQSDRALDSFQTARCHLLENDKYTMKNKEYLYEQWALFELEDLCISHYGRLPLNPVERMVAMCHFASLGKNRRELAEIKEKLRHSFRAALDGGSHSAAYYFLHSIIENEIKFFSGDSEREKELEEELEDLAQSLKRVKFAKPIASVE